MNLMILGSIAIDSVKTPFAEAENLPGGSAIYASMASSYFISPQTQTPRPSLPLVDVR